MILRVTFENILSFYEETQISFVAGKSSTHAEQISRAKKRDDISVLKSGIIYGANASGKCNIIKAIDVLRKIATGKFPDRPSAEFQRLLHRRDRPQYAPYAFSETIGVLFLSPCFQQGFATHLHDSRMQSVGPESHSC